MKTVTITSETILLAQFLKWANVTGSGGEAKQLIQDGLVKVNGEVEVRRGRQLLPGDTVEVGAQQFQLTKDA